MTPISCTGVILAGGLNTRFGGNNKALAEIGGQSILGRILKSFDTLFPETMVVTNAPLDYLAWNTLIVKDILAIRSPLAGLHTALNYARTPYIFVTACDAPFIKTTLIRTILDEIDAKNDIIVPETESRMQPLCAVYSRQCLPAIEEQLRQEKAAARADSNDGKKRNLNRGLKILNLFKKVRVKKIPEQTLIKADPDLLSFFNANSPEDFALAERILSENPTL